MMSGGSNLCIYDGRPCDVPGRGCDRCLRRMDNKKQEATV